MGLHRPAALTAGGAPVVEPESIRAAVQPLLEHVTKDGFIESNRVARAWELYESPEVRFTCRQFSNAFGQAKIIIGKREVLWEDPKPILEPSNKVESKAVELLSSFAGGPVGQADLLDRMGTYFTVPGDMVLVGAYDPARMADPEYGRFARWDVWSTSEVRWNGTSFRIRTNAVEDVWQNMPDWIKHVRVWNRHPRRGWESDSPVLSMMSVIELIGLYDDRLVAETLSRLIGAGVWMVPQGLSFPTTSGKPGNAQDFINLMKEIASLSMQDRRSAAALVPILIEAAADDIAAAKDGLIDFSSKYDERILELQQGAIKRFATGVDLPSEAVLGMSQATHWNANLISEDRVQTFIVPSLRRGCGNLTIGWLRPALQAFGFTPQEAASVELWFDPAGIKTRVDLGEETQWAADRFLVKPGDTKYALGLGQNADPTDEELKRMLLLNMARLQPEYTPQILEELGIKLDHEFAFPKGTLDEAVSRAAAEAAAKQGGDGRPGPQQANGQDKAPRVDGPGRSATLSTRRD